MRAKIAVLNVASMLFSVAGLTALATSANADPTPVATIGGCYDCNAAGQPGAGYSGDTPVLFFNNTTGGDLVNAQMVLTGYQADNNGVTETVSLGTLGAGQSNFVWGGNLPSVGILTEYDYDDEYNAGTGSPNWLGGDPANSTCGQPANDPTLGATGCVDGGGTYWYAQTGNFSVTFTAIVSGGTYDTDAVYSVFSPADNATGGFVGWEGLDPSGYSESPYDVHSGIVTGNLANIYLGVPPPVGVPEPSTWAILLLGLFGIGFMVRGTRRKDGISVA
jgi:hypothetical protein